MRVRTSMSPACRFLHHRAAAGMQRSFRQTCCTALLPGAHPSTSRCLQVKATPIPGKRADHQGIRVQLIGQIELAAERGHPHDFVSLGGQTLGFRLSPYQPATSVANTLSERQDQHMRTGLGATGLPCCCAPTSYSATSCRSGSLDAAACVCRWALHAQFSWADTARRQFAARLAGGTRRGSITESMQQTQLCCDVCSAGPVAAGGADQPAAAALRVQQRGDGARLLPRPASPPQVGFGCPTYALQPERRIQQ